MQRRVFLKLFGGAAAANVGVRLANASTTPVPTCVDFHCHAILPSFVDGLRQLGIDAACEEGFPLPKWNVEDHLKFMEDAGIDLDEVHGAGIRIDDGLEDVSAGGSVRIRIEFGFPHFL